jgi:hypothetical protein
MARIGLLGFALPVEPTTGPTVRRAAGWYGIVAIELTRTGTRSILPLTHRPVSVQ